MANLGTALTSHPLEATAEAIGKTAGMNPNPAAKGTLFQSVNEGPANIIAKVSGATSGGNNVDNAPYFTNMEGIPWPDP